MWLTFPRTIQRVDPLHASARHQALHHFVAKSEWSDATVMAGVRDWILPLLGLKSGGYWIIDDTGFSKKGKHSVGGGAPVLWSTG